MYQLGTTFGCSESRSLFSVWHLPYCMCIHLKLAFLESGKRMLCYHSIICTVLNWPWFSITVILALKLSV